MAVGAVIFVHQLIMFTISALARAAERACRVGERARGERAGGRCTGSTIFFDMLARLRWSVVVHGQKTCRPSSTLPPSSKVLCLHELCMPRADSFSSAVNTDFCL